MIKADKLTISLSILSVTFAGLLYYFSLCDASLKICDRPWPFKTAHLKEMYSIFCLYKSKIGGTFFIIIILFHLISYINVETGKKKWLRAFLRHVIKQDLGGDQFETRITISRKQRGIMFWPKYIYRSMLKRKQFWERIKNIPNPMVNYLVPYIRYSYPDAYPSTSYFSIPKCNDDKACSVVSLCYKKGTHVNVDAPYIQDIELPENKRRRAPSERDKIREYQQKTSMPSYRKLRLIDRRANHIFAALIQCDSEKDDIRWGVIVFDKNSEDSDNLSERLKDVISGYLKITQFSLKIIH